MGPLAQGGLQSPPCDDTQAPGTSRDQGCPKALWPTALLPSK